MRNFKSSVLRFLAILRTKFNHFLMIDASQNNLDIAQNVAITAELNTSNSHDLINPYINITHPTFE